LRKHLGEETVIRDLEPYCDHKRKNVKLTYRVHVNFSTWIKSRLHGWLD